MNITRLRQDARKVKIAQMTESIRKAEKPDYNKLVMLCCSEWGISKRTANEYLEIAKFNVENGQKDNPSNAETNPK